MRRKLGQHFLRDEGALRKIADSLEIGASDVIVEIGAGHGELTLEIKNQISKIKNNSIKIVAIEKDEKLVQILQKKFASDKNIEIIQGDALKILPPLIYNSLFIIHNYKLVGNIPYYITGYLLRILGELEEKPSLIVLTIQKEVAERICAKPPKMNLLAASVQFWAQPQIIDLIKKTAFDPPPEVESAIIKLTPQETTVSKKDYYGLIRLLFKQPRKTILNNLGAGLKKTKSEIKKKLKNMDIGSNCRPQDLKITEMIALSTEIYPKK